MPSNRRSLSLTDAYRRRLLELERLTQRTARDLWPVIEELDTTNWAERMAPVVTRAQIRGVRLTGAFLGAFLRSETRKGRTVALDTRRYAGITRGGRPLREALESPLIGVKAALKQGRPPGVALQLGLARATRLVGFEAIQAPREALLDAIEADERFEGFQRSVAGTCAACMAFSGEPNFEVHPSCQCVPMPVVRGVIQRYALPTGAALFAAMSEEDQERAIGPEAARLVRDGEADLKDFVAHSRQEEQPDFITQKPVKEVAT